MADAARNSRGAKGPWSHLHLIGFLVGIGMCLTFFLWTALFVLVSLDIPDLSSINKYSPPITSFILDKDENIIEKVFYQNRTVISLTQMPDLLPKAFIAAEDARFYQHGGIDAWSILRALVHNIKAGEREQGGSTITQQVARALLLNREKTYKRKLREAILAYRIDRMLSKDEILHIYLNEIYLGEGAYGVEAAARTYFGKSASKLNLAEASMLAGLPQAPSRYSPFKQYALAKKRQAYVLNRMTEDGYITAEEARSAYRHSLLWAPVTAESGDFRYITEEVKKYVGEKYGQEKLYGGGLRIHTSTDEKLQKEAVVAVQIGLDQWRSRHKKKKVNDLPEAALIAVDVPLGHIRALVGGRDFEKSQFNRAVQARRQPGSAFKPFLYAAAFDHGFTPASVFDDSPLSLKGARPGEFWQPKNFKDEYFGPTTLRNALIHSRNVVSVKLLQEIGVKTLVRVARDCGIRSELSPNLSLALGSSEVTLMELTAAYGVFARGGVNLPPILITKIVDHDGFLLEEEKSSPKRVLDERIAYQITHLLSKVIREGTGKAARGLDMAAAGKTGTTDNSKDAWFVGFIPNLAAGVWMGFDKAASLGDGETGGVACAPIWRDFMEKAVSYRTDRDFVVPDGIAFMPINPHTGRPEAGDSPNVAWTPFLRENTPVQSVAPLETEAAARQTVDPLEAVRRWLRGAEKFFQ